MLSPTSVTCPCEHDVASLAMRLGVQHPILLRKLGLFMAGRPAAKCPPLRLELGGLPSGAAVVRDSEANPRSIAQRRAFGFMLSSCMRQGALADIKRAAEMEPEDADWLSFMAEIKCHLGDHKVRALQVRHDQRQACTFCFEGHAMA